MGTAAGAGRLTEVHGTQKHRRRCGSPRSRWRAGAAADDQLAVLAGVVEQGMKSRSLDTTTMWVISGRWWIRPRPPPGGCRRSFAVTRGAVGNVEMVNLVRLQHPADAVGVERRPRQAGDIAKRAFDLDAPVVLAQMLQHRRDVHGHAMSAQ